ncbi:oxaloacetate decarboxylase, mitochondrial isoform X2 [Lycorma delicatula]|uniref:oxaloacetate decarboxylase, mitochondrial isoform X2 n=1 Tax=Lycorma delicatula TaxID=130591 RepID=UPI003F516652
MSFVSLAKERKVALPDKPIIFLKPTSSYVQEGQAIEVPKQFDVYEEVELGIIIGQRCKNIRTSDAMKYVGGYCLALDLTAVDDMKEVRSKGLPWTFGKGFDTACPVSKFIPHDAIKQPTSLYISCSVNGKILQESQLTDMIFSIEELIAFSSQFMTLEPCDVILTGSPSGSGPIRPGDVIEAKLDNILSMNFSVI